MKKILTTAILALSINVIAQSSWVDKPDSVLNFHYNDSTGNYTISMLPSEESLSLMDLKKVDGKSIRETDAEKISDTNLGSDQNKITPEGALNYLNGFLKGHEGECYKLVHEEREKYEGLHQRYQQYYKNFPVENGIYMLHFKAGIFSSIDGEYIDVREKVQLTQGINKDVAFAFAKGYLEEMDKVSSPKNVPTNYELLKYELWIVNSEKSILKNQKFVLAFELTIPPYIVRVDAENGRVLSCVSNISYNNNATGTIYTRYSGTQSVTDYQYTNGVFKLEDHSRNIGGINLFGSIIGGSPYPSGNDFYDNDNDWVEFAAPKSNKTDAAVDVFWGLQQTYDYYKNIQNRDSYDGSGSLILATPYAAGDNSYWDPANNRMYFGLGDAMQPKPNSTLDIVGHEFTHGVAYSKGCFYAGQSDEGGNLSEGFSDIFGACIENYANTHATGFPAKNIWVDGSEIIPQGYRNLKAPKTNNEPDTYLGVNWGTSNYHERSTILSHWFYLLSQGSATTDGKNDNEETFIVAPLTISVAEQIAYQSLNYIKSSGNFFDARAASVNATKFWYSSDPTLANKIAQVLKAWHAVGLGSPYGYATGKMTPGSIKYIANVKVNGQDHINNYNACGYYCDSRLSSAIAMNIIGPSISISLSSETATSRYWKVYIDFNNDRDFDDSGEQIYSSSATNPVVNFSVPLGAGIVAGYTYMRVMMSSNSINGPYMEMADGEVEDYRVNLIGPSCDAPTNLNATSITTTSAVLQWTPVSYATSYNLELYYDGTWNDVVGSSTITSAPILGLTPGIAYQFRVKTNCQYGLVSSVSNSCLFYTLSNCNADPYESNETQSTAKYISAFSFTAGSDDGISAMIANRTALVCKDNPQYGGTSGDVDWFKFSNEPLNNTIFTIPIFQALENYPDVKIEVTNLPSNCDVALCNSNGDPIGFTQNSTTSSKTIVCHPCYGLLGTYYVKVFSNAGFSITQNYNLAVKLRAVSYPCNFYHSNIDTDSSAEFRVEEKNSLSIFPNPSSGIFNLHCSNEVKLITVTDIVGRVILKRQMESGVNDYEFDISEQPSGMYFVTESGDFGMLKGKIGKN